MGGRRYDLQTAVRHEGGSVCVCVCVCGGGVRAVNCLYVIFSPVLIGIYQVVTTRLLDLPLEPSSPLLTSREGLALCWVFASTRLRGVHSLQQR